MRVITKIEPLVKPLPVKKRVAAYARVSVRSEDSLRSLSAQISYYNEFIQKRSDWEYAGVYADEALTGTREDRPEFQRLMDDCRNGKIDIILIKSISRLARNTVTLLETVRELKERNIDIWFEKENIRSLSGDGELMLTILSSFAQEESLSNSENMKWRFRNRFKDGRPSTTIMLGYKLVDEKFIIIPEEAEAVRMIFTEFVNGAKKVDIKKKLTASGLRPKRGGEWNISSINEILRNEKYTGVLLLQKHFRIDHISKKICKNHGELPMYRVENNHEAIIDKDTFEKAQIRLAQYSQNRDNTKRGDCKKATKQPSEWALLETSKQSAEQFPEQPRKKPREKHQEPDEVSGGSQSRFREAKIQTLSGKIYCGQCGQKYRRTINRKGTASEIIMWACGTYSKKGKAACPAEMIPERVFTDIGFEFSKIIVQRPETLVITKPDGEETVMKWHRRTYKEAWTDEKRQQAREKAIANFERRRAACQQQKEQ